MLYGPSSLAIPMPFLIDTASSLRILRNLVYNLVRVASQLLLFLAHTFDSMHFQGQAEKGFFWHVGELFPQVTRSAGSRLVAIGIMCSVEVR